MSKSIPVAEAVSLALNLGCNTLEQWGFYSHFLRIRRNLDTLGTIDIRRDRVGRRAVVRACLRPTPVTHVLAFDGTDQAECRAEAQFDRMAARSSVGIVTCEHCLVRLDDLA